MNASRRIFVNAGVRSAAARLLGGAAIATLLSGCGHIASTKVDPSSPIAPEVAKLATQDTDYPSFRELPARPTDLRPPRIYGERAAQLEQARDQLAAATAPNTWTLNNSETFAARARSDAGPDLPPATATNSEGFAAEARKRATPPPPRR
jgi:hypothetical protein